MHAFRAILAVTGLGILLAAGTARAGVDVEVSLPLNAKGSLNGETDVIRFWAARGTTLTLKFAAAKGHAFTGMGATLYDEFDESDVPFPETTVATAIKVQFKGLVLPSTGRYRLSLEGEGFGDYTIALTSKVKTVWKGENDLTGGNAVVEFAAPAGSTATLGAKRKKGGMATPRWGNVHADDGVNPAYDVDLTAIGKLGATGHTAPAGPLPGAEVDATLANTGEAGFATWQVKLKAPKARKLKLDLRSKVLGRPGGGETMFARSVDASGGAVTVDDGGSDLDGASVQFPAEALTGPTFVSIGSSTTPLPPDVDDQAAGPSVDLGPGGVEFGGEVMITLPFDSSMLPVGATENDIRVLVVEDDGTVRTEVPDSVDGEADTVTISTTSFSVFTPIVHSGMPQIGLDPGGDIYWVLQYYSEMVRDVPDEDDSRARRLGFGQGMFVFHGNGDFDFSMNERGHEWQNVDGDGTPILQGFPSFNSSEDSGEATWSYGGDGESVVLSLEGSPVFRTSRDGRYMVARDYAPTSTEANAALLLRANKQSLNQFQYSLIGKWHVGILDLRSAQMPTNGGHRPAALRGIGTMHFTSFSSCTFSGSMRSLGFNAVTGARPQSSVSFSNVLGGHGGVLNETTFNLTLPAFAGFPAGASLRVFPGEGLDAMFAIPETSDTAPLALVFVKAGDAADESLLVGDHDGVAFGIVPTVYGLMNPHTPAPDDFFFVGDFDLYSLVLDVTIPGDGTLALDEFGHDVVRDPLGGVQGVRVSDDGLVTPGDSATVSVSVNANGRVALGGSAGEAGATTRDGMFTFFVQSPSTAYADFGFAFLVRSPAPPPE